MKKLNFICLFLTLLIPLFSPLTYSETLKSETLKIPQDDPSFAKIFPILKQQLATQEEGLFGTSLEQVQATRKKFLQLHNQFKNSISAQESHSATWKESGTNQGQFLNGHQSKWSEDLSYFKDYKIILVKGIFNNFYAQLFQTFKIPGLSFPAGFYDSLFEQYHWLKELGYDVEIGPKNTEESCIHNSIELAKMIRQSPKKVILYSHSKGGLDLLHALVNQPELRTKVAGWISIQTPFMGTPLLKVVENNFISGQFANIVMEFLSGHGDALHCSVQSYRKKFNEENFEEISQINQEIPLLTLGTWEEIPSLLQKNLYLLSGQWQRVSMLDPLARFIQWQGVKLNDGMSPTHQSCLKQQDCLILPGMDHAGPVMDMPPFKSLGKEKRRLLTHTLLAMLKEKMQKRTKHLTSSFFEAGHP